MSTFYYTVSIILSLIIFGAVKRILRLNKLYLQDFYILGILIYTLGVSLTFLNNPAERNNADKLLAFCSVTLLSSIIGYFISLTVTKPARPLPHIRQQATRQHTYIIGFIAGFIVVFNIGFIYLVYTRIFQDHLGGVFALLDIRKTISSGVAGYFAPGLVKQVRDILSPTLISYLILFYRGRGKPHLIVATALSTTLAMMMGGQRMPLLTLLVTIFASAYLANRVHFKRLSKKYYLLFAVAGIALTFGINLALGRSNADDGTLNAISTLLLSLAERVVVTVPEENAKALDFLINSAFQPFALWLADLSILLPGTQTSLSTKMHSLLGGSNDGNSVLGLPLDIYLNAGYPGLFLVPCITQFFLALLERLLSTLNAPILYSSKLVILIYLPFAYSFYLFLLNGGIFLLFMCTTILLLSGLKPQSTES
jgi:hypothetical protein